MGVGNRTSRVQEEMVNTGVLFRAGEGDKYRRRV